MSPKTRIVISSILKPVFDARNYKKIGITLAESGFYEVHITGYPENNSNAHPKIQVYPSSRFSRLSLARLIQPWKALKIWIKVKPDILIVNTHELLIVSLSYKILFGAIIIYDVQENYNRNIRQSSAYPVVLRQILASYVWLKEQPCSRFVNGFILAEKCYSKELSFIREPYEICENKSLEVAFSKKSKKSSKISFVYSGTIAKEYGIFDAIGFTVELRKRLPDLQLTIIGYCPNARTWKKLTQIIDQYHFIKILGGDTLVTHNQIVKHIIKADFCLLPYRHPSYYSDRVPTRLYECLSLQTPMIIRQNPAWQFLFDEFDAFIFSDFKTVNPETLELIKRGKFYSKGDLNNARWINEKKKLLHFFDKMAL